MDDKLDTTIIEAILRGSAYITMFLLYVLVFLNFNVAEKIELHIIATLLVSILITIIVLLNYNEMQFSTNSLQINKPTINKWDSFQAILLFFMGLGACISVIHYSQLSYKEFEYFRDHSLGKYLYNILQYVLFIIGITSLAFGSTEFIRKTNTAIRYEINQNDSPVRMLTVTQLVTNIEPTHRNWRTFKKDFNYELRQQLEGCIQKLSNSELLNTASTHWKIDRAWKEVVKELFSIMSEKYYWGEDQGFENLFRVYCEAQSIYEQFMDKIIDIELDELAKSGPKYRMTFSRLRNLLSLFKCEDLIQSDEGVSESKSFNAKCKQMIFVLSSLKHNGSIQRESLYSLREEIIHLLRHIDSTNFSDGKGRMMRDSIDLNTNLIVIERNSELTKLIQIQITKGDPHSLPDISANTVQTDSMKRLESITEKLVNI
jgi:hypothetical protein